MKPSEILAAAEQMSEAPAAPSYWPRATAVLARQALEERMIEVLAERAPGIGRTNVRAQLLCLIALHDDPEQAASVAHTWGALSSACHHHCYELDPTAGELASWIETVDRFVRS